MILACTLLAVAVLILLLPPPAARANAADETIFDPPGTGILYASPGVRSDRLDEVQALGADTIRVPANWRDFAPAPGSAAKPQGFDGSDPTNYPPGAFDALDATIEAIYQRGLNVLLTPGGPAPRWATAGGRSGRDRPDAAEFGDFAQALGARYSGSCTCGTATILPRVSFWSVWNEPNLSLYLQPQFENGKVVSGRIYRALYLAAQRGLDATGHSQDRLLIGEPSAGRAQGSSDPISFLRSIFCIDRHWHRNRGCVPIRASGWAQHPYLPGIPPWAEPKDPDYIAIGSLSRLTRALGRARRAGATTTRLPVYVTEFGIESYPEPAKRFGVSPRRQAEYLGISEYLLYENPQVRSYAQFLITDDSGKNAYLNFQTGLRFASGAKKPAYDAFPMTLVVRRLRSGVLLWGHVRPGSGEREVEIFRSGDGAGPLLTVTTDQDGYFAVKSGFRKGATWRASTPLPYGGALAGPWIRAYRFPVH